MNWVCFFNFGYAPGRIGFVFSVVAILVAPCYGAVYVRPPLMHEPACFVRKMFVFWVVDCCKCLCGIGLRICGKLIIAK